MQQNALKRKTTIYVVTRRDRIAIAKTSNFWTLTEGQKKVDKNKRSSVRKSSTV